MGIVFKARQISLNRIVAIKMILSGQFAGPDEVTRFYIEAEAAGNLDHVGIVSVFDVGCYQDQHYYSMAFVEGKSLAARIKEGALPPREAAMLAKKIAGAIQAAHDQGIVHRDLKPGNVLLDNRDEPRITDFGLAKRVEGDSNLTTTGMLLGTPSYMPPEQAAGKEIDAAADVYSLGAILYAMLTGRPPFKGNSQLETIMQVLQEEPVIPRRIDRNIPGDLEAICLKCLEKDPVDRYRTATVLSEDLQRFLSGEPIRARNDWSRRIRKWTIREPVLAAHLTVTSILLAILFFSYWIWQENGRGSDDNFRILKGNVLILLGWALVVLVFQKVQNVFKTKSTIPFTWAAMGLAPMNCTLLAVLVFLVGFFAGFYIVPLQSLLQFLSPTDERGRFFGTANALSFVFISGAGLIYIALSRSGLPPAKIPLACAVLAAIGTFVGMIELNRITAAQKAAQSNVGLEAQD